MKKAFTIAEAVISAAMLGVLAVVLFPMLQEIQPNKDKTSYNKALYSMQSAVSNVMEDTYSIAANRLLDSTTSEWKDEDFLKNLTREEFCNAVAENFNVSGKTNCGEGGTYDRPNFVTSDGMRFWNVGGSGNAKFGEAGNDGSQIIRMDREMKESDWKKRQKDFAPTPEKWKDNLHKGKGLKLIVRYDGKVQTGEASGNGEWDYENKLIKKSMSMNLKDEK